MLSMALARLREDEPSRSRARLTTAQIAFAAAEWLRMRLVKDRWPAYQLSYLAVRARSTSAAGVSRSPSKSTSAPRNTVEAGN